MPGKGDVHSYMKLGVGLRYFPDAHYITSVHTIEIFFHKGRRNYLPPKNGYILNKKINNKIHTRHSELKNHNYDLTLRYDYEIVPQPYHPAAQDRLPTEG